MTRITTIRHEFVDVIPDSLTAGALYVCIPYATAVHLCCCGCGSEVVTPFSPTDWSVTFDGQSVSLRPSIGNWSFECRSHYWIQRDRVRWASTWTHEQVSAGRQRDDRAKEAQYGSGAAGDTARWLARLFEPLRRTWHRWRG
jgi:hypothetical protein